MTFKPVFLLASLVAVSACDSNTRVPPTMPSPSNSSGQAPSVTPTGQLGRIRLTSTSAPDGAVIQAADCPYLEGLNLVCGNWSGTFDVDFDTPIEEAVLTVQFYGDDGDCGMAYSPSEPFAGGRQRIVVSGIEFSQIQEDGSVLSRCMMPRTTTRMVAKFWRRRSQREPLLTETFGQKYSFEKR